MSASYFEGPTTAVLLLSLATADDDMVEVAMGGGNIIGRGFDVHDRDFCKWRV